VLAGIVVALVLIVPLVALFAGGGSGDDGNPAKAPAQPEGMRVERDIAGLTAYVTPDVNTPERAGGARSVTLRCLDADGQLVAAQDEAWPFTGTDQNTLDPHVHVTLDSNQLGLVSSCRLVETEPLLQARMP
jgi:hypothetical protein